MQAFLLRTWGALAIFWLLAGTACAPAATPTPTTAAAKPTAAPAKPGPSAAAKPAEASPPAAKPAASPSAKAAGGDWKTEWDKLVAAAKQEGRVVVAGSPGETSLAAAMAFEKAFPGIKVEYSGVQGAEFGPKLLAEREGGQYLWDVHMGGTTTIMTVLMPKGVLEPLRPVLIMPEVLDSSKWLGGFEDIWIDKGHQLIASFEGRLKAIAHANRNLVPESELNSLNQLLDPKYKGKMIMQDPRIAGPAGPPSGYLLKVNGEEWLRKFFGQDPVVTKDARQAVEAVVRGAYPVGVFLDPLHLEYFVSQGVADHVKPVEIQSTTGSQLTSGFGSVILVNRAPHPNAAKVFINWLLSQDGQRAYVQNTNLNSRRLDVEGPAATAPNPSVKYLDIMKEEYLPDLAKAQEIAKELLK